MISLTASFATHVYTTVQGIQAVRRVLGYVLPYSNMAAVKKNYNSKHLSKGDPLPPFNGKLRVYNMRFCPFAQRTILALNAKDIDYEIVNIDLHDKPEWLASKSAFTKVPALEISDGVSIYESLVTVEYLDDVYPQRPLLPKDPVLKAKDKIIIEATAPRGTKFLDGGEPGYADYMIWPWFERLITLDDERIKMDNQKYKLMLEYINNMLQDPVVSEYLIPKEVLREFHTAFVLGTKPKYDLLLEN